MVGLQRHEAGTPELTGRETELGRLLAELEEARRTRAHRFVVVRGDAGVGRSALLTAFASRVPSPAHRLVRASGDRTRRAPWSLTRALAEDLLALVRPASATAWLHDVESRLGPVLGGEGTTDPLAPCAALVETLERAARDVPLVVLLDDVDAADAASLGAIGYLAARLSAPSAVRGDSGATAGVLVVLSLRDGDLSGPLAELVTKVPALSLPLGALDLDGVRAFLSRTNAAERLFAATGGVPGRLADLLSPSEPIDFAARRLERLAPADRELLAVVALAQAADDAVLAAASGRRDLAARLQRLVGAGLLTAAPGAGRTRYTVARAVDAEAAGAALSSKERARLLVALADAFAAAGDDESAFRSFGEAGDVRAVAFGLRAAERLERAMAPAAAESVLERVVEQASGSDRAAALLRLAALREQRGDVRGALAAIGRARPFVSVADRRALRARAARLCIVLGAPKAAERLSRTVLALGDAPDAATWDARVAFADSRFLRGAWDEALAAADALHDAPADVRLVAGNVRGKALLTLGRLDEAKETFAHNAADALAAHLPAERTRALLNVGVTAHRQGARHEARAAYRESLAAGVVTPFVAVARANLSSLALEDGDAEEALAQGTRAIAELAHHGRLKEQAHAAQNLARVYHYLGELERAAEVAAHAQELSKRVGDPYLVAGARLVEAEVRLARRDAGTADLLEDVAGAFERLGNPRYLRESLLLLAEAHLVAGRADAAFATIGRAREAGATAVQALAAELHLIEAELLLARDVDAASEALATARSALLAEPHLELPARLYWLSGAIAERRGEVSRARAERLQAARILEELAGRVPPERRTRFLSRPRRRTILESAGVARLDVAEQRPAAPIATEPTGALVGSSPSMARLRQLIDRIGPSHATVLVRGESGTGKELVARALHERSPRRDLPLVAVNCGALNEELLLSELFGHEKGSFTGAVKEKRGRFELADGGTIFLDEIGDISPRAQVALLRVLQERTFERVGGTRTLKVDVRVVCATNRNLEELMTRGLFREDLYYRLRGATLTLPPLRERLDDLPSLSAHVLGRVASERGESGRTLSSEALRMLGRYRWPGNVRELINVLESSCLFSAGPVIGPEGFEMFPELLAPPAPVAPVPALPVPAVPPMAVAPVPPAVVEPAVVVEAAAPTLTFEAPVSSGPVDFYAVMRARALSLKDLRRDVEIECIAAALQEGAGNISEAARLLRMKRSRLSQVVNAEPRLRSLTRGGSDGGPDEEGDDDGTDVA